jgi:hypothetical protein
MEEAMSIDISSPITSSSVDFEAPLGGVTRGKLAVISGVPKITIVSDASMPQLLRAHFERPTPDVNVKDGEVRIRYPNYSLLNWLVYWGQPLADLMINATIPWSIAVHGGVSRFVADLSQVQLFGLELRGGVSHLWASLPEPVGTMAIRIDGGVSDTALHRPANVPVRIQVQGGVSSMTLDEQHFGSMGGKSLLATPDYNQAANRYDIQISGGASNISIISQTSLDQAG